MKKLIAFAVVALVGCGQTQAQIKSETDAAGNVCEVVVQSTLPQYAPLCSTAVQVAEAIEALIAAKKAGNPGAAPNYMPTQMEVYTYLAAHGAAHVK